MLSRRKKTFFFRSSRKLFTEESKEKKMFKFISCFLSGFKVLCDKQQHSFWFANERQAGRLRNAEKFIKISAEHFPFSAIYFRFYDFELFVAVDVRARNVKSHYDGLEFDKSKPRRVQTKMYDGGEFHADKAYSKFMYIFSQAEMNKK